MKFGVHHTLDTRWHHGNISGMVMWGYVGIFPSVCSKDRLLYVISKGALAL